MKKHGIEMLSKPELIKWCSAKRRKPPYKLDVHESVHCDTTTYENNQQDALYRLIY